MRDKKCLPLGFSFRRKCRILMVLRQEQKRPVAELADIAVPEHAGSFLEKLSVRMLQAVEDSGEYKVG